MINTKSSLVKLLGFNDKDSFGHPGEKNSKFPVRKNVRLALDFSKVTLNIKR